MERSKKALFLALLATPVLLSGCGKKSETKEKEIYEKEDGIYIETSEGEITQVLLDSKVFEAGEHHVFYNVYVKINNIKNEMPEGSKNSIIPSYLTVDGYELVEADYIVGHSGTLLGRTYHYVNTKPVTVMANLNTQTLEIEYTNFGTVIEKDASLKLTD